IVYRAIVYRPFKGEVVDGIVTQVTKVGVFAEAGPLTIFISKYTVQIEDRIRIRIIGLRVDASDIVRKYFIMRLIIFHPFFIGLEWQC
ncbi:unnamed protein product, partial [Trichobilharzia regenti]